MVGYKIIRRPGTVLLSGGLRSLGWAPDLLLCLLRMVIIMTIRELGCQSSGLKM